MVQSLLAMVLLWISDRLRTRSDNGPAEGGRPIIICARNRMGIMRHPIRLVLAAILAAGPSVPGLAAPTVTVILTVGKSTYLPGQPVQLTVTLANPTAQEATVELATSQVYDVLIFRGQQVIWRWSEGKAFLQVISRVTLRPGEARPYDVVWDQRDDQGRQVPAGDYTAQARIRTREPLLTNQIPFRIGTPAGRPAEPVIVARPIERSGASFGEVVVNGRVVLRVREPAGGLSAAARAEIIARRLRLMFQRGLRPQELEVATVGGQAAIVWRDQLLVTADANHARLNQTPPITLARLWRTQLISALSP